MESSCNLNKNTSSPAVQVISHPALPKAHPVGERDPKDTGLVCLLPPSLPAQPSCSCPCVSCDFCTSHKGSRNKGALPKAHSGEPQWERRNRGDSQPTALIEDRHRCFVPTFQDRGLPLPHTTLHIRKGLFPKLQSQLLQVM